MGRVISISKEEVEVRDGSQREVEIDSTRKERVCWRRVTWLRDRCRQSFDRLKVQSLQARSKMKEDIIDGKPRRSTRRHKGERGEIWSLLNASSDGWRRGLTARST